MPIIIATLLFLAVCQALIQSIFFLHILQEKKPRWNLIVFASTISIILVIVVFSIWIMNHLNYNMMPHHTWLKLLPTGRAISPRAQEIRSNIWNFCWLIFVSIFSPRRHRVRGDCTEREKNFFFARAKKKKSCRETRQIKLRLDKGDKAGDK